jgi:hypothetical protein
METENTVCPFLAYALRDLVAWFYLNFYTSAITKKKTWLGWATALRRRMKAVEHSWLDKPYGQGPTGAGVRFSHRDLKKPTRD